MAYIRKMLRQENDGFWYIDYLRAFESELDVPELYPKYLMNHRDIIVNSGIDPTESSRLAVKYRWLTEYHNNVVNDLPEEFFSYYEEDRESFLM